MFPGTSLFTCRTQKGYPLGPRNFDMKRLIRNAFSERPITGPFPRYRPKGVLPQRCFRAFLTHFWRNFDAFLTHFIRSSFPNRRMTHFDAFWRISDAFLTHFWRFLLLATAFSENTFWTIPNIVLWGGVREMFMCFVFSPGARWIVFAIRIIEKRKCKCNFLAWLILNSFKSVSVIFGSRIPGLLTGRQEGDESALHPTPTSKSEKFKSVSSGARRAPQKKKQDLLTGLKFSNRAVPSAGLSCYWKGNFVTSAFEPCFKGIWASDFPYVLRMDKPLAWPPLQSLAVKKNFFLCKFWAVKNF